MKIKDLTVGMNNVTVEGTIISKGRTRSFISRKTGRVVRVAEAKLKDESGEIILVLWNKQINAVNKGDKIKIINGYVNKYRGNLQLNVGRNGSIEKV